MNGMDENAQRDMIGKFNRKRPGNTLKKALEEHQSRLRRKRIEEKNRRRSKNKVQNQRFNNNAVEIELTKLQSKELLYVAFKPTKKELFLKRFIT